MTETLQQKIESSYQIPEVINHCNLKYHRVVVNKAIQELREQINALPCEECKPDNCYQNAPLILKSKVLALIGEKRT